MNNNNDLTFFTNEKGKTLADRFRKILMNNTQFFDVLVGYFRTSGFYEMYEALEGVEKIRILVGLNVDKKTVELLEASKDIEYLSTNEIKKNFNKIVKKEMDNSEDKIDIEKGIKKFIEFIQDEKLEMRIYPDEPLHAKVYIIRKNEKKSEDFGKLITGSSNFSHSGLKGNLEFNVELKNKSDVEYALEKFEKLWEKGIDITKDYIETITKKTWIREDITPYELYLKFLYEYFYDEINDDKIKFKGEMLPEGFKKFQYQIDAVNQAKKILNKYNGVFLADVVGLGKTYIATLLAKELKGGRKLIICPPVLVSYWEKTLVDFGVSATVKSLGKLEDILENYENDYFKYVFIDEAHRFRNDGTSNYAKLHEICLNKKIILISATPQNNYSTDILNLIKLFQPKNNSNIIEGQPNIENFFMKMLNNEKKSKKLYKNNSTEENKNKFEKIIKKNSAEIRDKVLRKIMVRRVRSEIEKYYKEDMEKQGLTFPKIGTPEQIIYKFDDEIDKLFDGILYLINNLTYSRYKTLTYLLNPTEEEKTLISGQLNLKGFMKVLLIKRLESSFYAFSKSVLRFKESYINFIKMYNSGKIYISKKYDIYELLNDEEEEKIIELINDGQIKYYTPDNFNESFIKDLEKDLEILEEMNRNIKKINSDPKLDYFITELNNNNILKNSKKIIFTESKETAEYLKIQLQNKLNKNVIVFTGSSSLVLKDIIIENFDPNIPKNKQKNDIEILITTDVLAEGINLHRANILINYDLPWNPTRIMQRIGRINRVGTNFDKIHVFNFFPTRKSNEHISLKENIISKLQSFHNTFGEDSKFLTEDEEINSFEFSGEKLYEALNKNLSLDEENWDDSELEYLKIIRDIRDNNEELFLKIKNLPKKSRSSKCNNLGKENVVSFIRDGELKRIYICNSDFNGRELTFFEGVKILKCQKDEPKIKINDNFFDMLNWNKEYFKIKKEENIKKTPIKKIGNDAKFLKLIKGFENYKKTFSGKEEKRFYKIKELFENGYLSKEIIKNINNEIEKLLKKETNPHKLLDIVFEIIPDSYKNIEKTDVKNSTSKIEVILSEYIN
ncbi:ATP-dependent helicase [Tepiditoga spiralis]|uniref:ATP-dependent helicase n=1 Tax=Tepiditoga spiralis TaxID=2108365 RepID=A0A7G1G4G5_9BACT|nr:helicase-related protein [Tepiditoga spiralis]BBE30106.1 ATP-dependent helicase [Tepiditoga spiralis]